jgi:hypothetical protein
LRVWCYPRLLIFPILPATLVRHSPLATAETTGDYRPISTSFLTITIYCVLPGLPKYTPVVGFDVKNGFFQKAVFDVNKPILAIKLGVTLCLSAG